MSTVVEIDLRQKEPQAPAAAHRRGAVRTVMTSSTKPMGARGQRTPPRAPRQRHERVDARTWIAVAAGMLGAFMAVLDIQITNSSLRDILGTLSATQEEGSWISTAYLCAEIVVIPMTGAVRARLRPAPLPDGHHRAVPAVLDPVRRGLEPAEHDRVPHAAGLHRRRADPDGDDLVMTRLPPSKRAVGMAMFGLTATLAPAMGPTLGGYLTELYGWPSIFYINWVPGVLLIAGMYWGLDKEPMQPADPVQGRLAGHRLHGAGPGCLTIFLEEGNSKDWFESSFIITFAALALVGILGWVVTSFTRAEPFVNLRLYGQRNFLVATMLSAVIGMGLYGSSYLLPLYLGQIAGYSPMQIGEVIAWVGLPQLFVMPFVARCRRRSTTASCACSACCCSAAPA
jgi:DHA2 family multidrug resistance protein